LAQVAQVEQATTLSQTLELAAVIPLLMQLLQLLVVVVVALEGLKRKTDWLVALAAEVLELRKALLPLVVMELLIKALMAVTELMAQMQLAVVAVRQKSELLE